MVRRQGADPIRRMMKPYQGPQQTVVALTLRGGQRQVIGQGPNPGKAPWEDLIFEIGSITKLFTGILMCLLAEEGQIDPAAPLSEMSDQLGEVPGRITPERLMSHSSGLPNLYMPLWKALLHQQPEGPYADFTRADLLAWLQGWRGKQPASRLRHSYSNLGVGLLGEAMALHQGRAFAELLNDRVIRPLGLVDTAGPPLAEGQARFMMPHSAAGRPVMPWRFEALAAAGYLRSTAGDLGRLAARLIRAVQAPETALDRAMAHTVRPLFGLGRGGRRRDGRAALAQCAGWISVAPGACAPRFVMASGGTAGSTAALYVCPENQRAIAILSNNGVAANLWASARLSLANPLRQAQGYFADPQGGACQGACYGG